MPLILSLEQVNEQDRKLVGGKGFSLAKLAKAGFPVPLSLCISTEAYENFLADHGLAERIQLEFSRKNFGDMRWEEMWDAALRIRNLFLTLPMSPDLQQTLSAAIKSTFSDLPVAIRSSAPDEDARASSFAGLHESFINITGTAAVLDHIKLVWASLWSDAALLYRQELGLDTEKSAMGVLIQQVINGRTSGIMFTRDPNDQDNVVIEAVHGLNQALVDGMIEPDRWLVPRPEGKIRWSPAGRSQYMRATATGTELIPLPDNLLNKPPLEEKEIRKLVETGLTIENLANCPQDIEWTFAGEILIILQSRPISTTPTEDPMDKRSWYMSLHRSLENLQNLQDKIENELLPAMVHEADEMAAVNHLIFSDTELADEIERRLAIQEKWTAVYWQDFIPFAHGMRLFGQVYNDMVRPADPYEFMQLLVSTPLESMNRNRMMNDLAALVRNNKALRNQLKRGITTDLIDADFEQRLGKFMSRYGDLSCSLGLVDHCRFELETLLAVVLEAASHPPVEGKERTDGRKSLEENFFNRFPENQRQQAEDILDLGRASYRLRDDDNIYLGRIETQLAKVIEEARRRLFRSVKIAEERTQYEPHEYIRALRYPGYTLPLQKKTIKMKYGTGSSTRARQLVGQPAGPGIANGKARVIDSLTDLAQIKKGEVLVCDAVEPNMTFVALLAAAIVERRGGMLIHGAIIAREYGIPCVTGITEATKLIRTGDNLHVDGYLGIVTIGNTE
ncbi:MAG: PEP/pyruvate-binding domain-containing protein [Desulfobulbales bacterium]